MRNRNLAIATAMVSLVVAACGGSPAPTEVPSATAASTPVPAAAATATPAPTPAPTATPSVGPTGPLGDGRQIQTATLFADGSVLVAGGFTSGDGAIASATRYDPGTGTFIATGSMANARGGHTAILLPDGHVLIAGGGPASWTGGNPTFLATAELYDPKAGTFGPTGSMATPRGWHTATRLADGRVLVVGGENARTDLASAEIYDPKTGKFSPTGSTTVGRVYHGAAPLSDGRVLVEGGGSDYSGGKFLASAELYDPKAGTWTATGSMADRRNLLTATLLGDGRVLVAGGFGDNGPLASAELYDPKTGTFSPAGPGG